MVEKRRGHRKGKYRQEPASPNQEAGGVLVQLILASQDAASVRRIAEINGITPQEFLAEAIIHTILAPSMIDVDDGLNMSVFPYVHERYEDEQIEERTIEEGRLVYLSQRRGAPK